MAGAMKGIVIVSGPPGAGKSSVARRLAQQVAAPLAMHLHTDDIYTYVQKGFVPPWMPEARAQNTILMEAMAAQASVCALGGYAVFVDGIVGPWFFDPWLAAARADHLDLRYVVLMPDLATTLARATARTAPGAMNDAGVAGRMWQAFQDFPPAADQVLDTTLQSLPETVAAVFSGLNAGRFKLT